MGICPQVEYSMTNIELTTEDALLFVEFQKRYAFIKLMESLRVFDIRGGNVTINFNDCGEIALVDIHNFYRI